MLAKSPIALSLILVANAVAGGPKTPAPTPLREPSVTVFVTKKGATDSDACKFYHPELWATSNPATRDRVLVEINNDSRLAAIVNAAKRAAKDPAVKALVKTIEAKRPEKSGRVVFTVAKNEENYGSGASYGMRIGLISGGTASSSLPGWYVKCTGASPKGGYTYQESQYEFSGSHLNWTRLDGAAGGDAFPSLYEVVPEVEMEGSVEILEHLRSLSSKIPVDDGELSFVGRVGGEDRI